MTKLEKFDKSMNTFVNNTIKYSVIFLLIGTVFMGVKEFISPTKVDPREEFVKGAVKEYNELKEKQNKPFEDEVLNELFANE